MTTQDHSKTPPVEQEAPDIDQERSFGLAIARGDTARVLEILRGEDVKNKKRENGSPKGAEDVEEPHMVLEDINTAKIADALGGEWN